jgi:hypothetical protein
MVVILTHPCATPLRARRPEPCPQDHPPTHNTPRQVRTKTKIGGDLCRRKVACLSAFNTSFLPRRAVDSPVSFGAERPVSRQYP